MEQSLLDLLQKEHKAVLDFNRSKLDLNADPKNICCQYTYEQREIQLWIIRKEIKKYIKKI